MEELWIYATNDRNQVEKPAYCMVLTAHHSAKDKSMIIVPKSMVAKREGMKRIDWAVHRGFLVQCNFMMKLWEIHVILNLSKATEYICPNTRMNPNVM
jgi:hypothetical protein